MSFRVPHTKPCVLVEGAAAALGDIKERDQQPRVPAASVTATGLADRAEVDTGEDGRQGPITVFCTDDHAGFRDVVRDLIASTPGFVFIGEASSGVEAIALVPQLHPDVVLIDVHMPGMSGLQAAASLVSDHPGPLIVLMSADPIEVPPGPALRGGNVVFVTKRELCSRRLVDLWHGRWV